MKKIFVVLLTICLSSCVSQQQRKPPQIDVRVERCFPSFVLNACVCHRYIVTNSAIGRVGDSYDKELNYCDKYISFSPEDWIKILNVLRDASESNLKKKYQPKIETKYNVKQVLDEIPDFNDVPLL